MKSGHRWAIEWLKAHGATDVSLEQSGRGHARLRYTYDGQQRSQAISCSPRDPHWFKAFQREFRRVTTMPAGSHQINCRCG
jgi:hypothetical protein